ncbi:hypothetical protein BC830DRAFT_1112975 [Chytriomyces sp. MP71]|nr:hypothetical protein BC830DRAFT_1112975 [Chytriomyces sp. MP71]
MFDKSFWQSALDSTCADQSVQAEFYKPVNVQNFSIEYGSLGFTFDKPNANFRVTLNPSGVKPLDVTSLVTCDTQQTNDDGKPARFDRCTLAETVDDVQGVRFTWALNRPAGMNSCQMNLAEIVMPGVVRDAAVSGMKADPNIVIPKVGGSSTTSSMTGTDSGMTGTSTVANGTASTKLPMGAKVGIAAGVLILVVGVGVVAYRRAQMKKRKDKIVNLELAENVMGPTFNVRAARAEARA